MPFIYESGKEVATGLHGQHDFLYASGEPIPDNGDSNLVFESGSGIGGGWEKYDDGATPGVDLDPSAGILKIEHDGSATGTSEDALFPYAYRQNSLTYPLDVTFEFDFTANSRQNNLHMGVYQNSGMGGSRPHQNVSSVEFTHTEGSRGEGPTSSSATVSDESWVGIWDGAAEEWLDIIGLGSVVPSTVRIQYDGATATMTVDGASYTLNGAIDGPVNPLIEVEDDNDITVSETLTLTGYSEN